MSFVDNHFQKFEKLISSLWEVFWCIKSTALPVKNNTIRMNLTNMNHHLLSNLILWVAFICFDKVSNIIWRSFIYKNSCSLLGFLLNSGKKMIIRSIFVYSYNYSNNLFVFVFLTIIDQSEWTILDIVSMKNILENWEVVWVWLLLHLTDLDWSLIQV